MDYRFWSIIDILKENGYKTAEEIGIDLGLSEKTVRTRIHELQGHMAGSGAEVESKPRYGYCLKVTDRQRWQEFCGSRYEEKKTLPVDSNERVEYILATFLNREDYIKLETLSEFLYVSTKTLTNELRRVEYILNHFGIWLERKPHYGIRAAGQEFNKRCCILQNFYQVRKSFWSIPKKQETESERVAEILLRLMGESAIKFTETAFQNTVNYIQLSLTRMRKGLFIIREDAADPEREAVQEINLARLLYRELEVSGNGEPRLEVPEPEVFYTGIYIAGKRIVGGQGSGANMVVSERIDKLITEILEAIYLTYGVELREDLNLRIMLVQHLLPMEIRLRYGIPVEFNRADVKEKYMLAYTMAQLAVNIISDFYGKDLPENEKLCIATYFAMALEEKKTLDKRKNNILLVCVSGKASSRMLMYRFKQEFGEYIHSLTVCGMYEFDQMDLSEIDFIFTTVPIYKNVSVPIMVIHDFLDSSDIMAVRHFLRVGDMKFLNHFYRKELFFAGIQGETKEEVIHEICTRISQVSEIPVDFEESVLQREQFGPTDFGNLCAIPHPCRLMTKETLVAVAVLQQEVLWSTNPVRVVILTSLKEEKSEETQKFYEVTANFLSDREAVKRVIEEPCFENFENRITAMKR